MPEAIQFQFLLATFAGWIGRQQSHVITYKCVVERERSGELLKYYCRRAA